jgi:single-strand DNA-binding protein
MAGLNKVMLIGNVGADPEVRNLESGVTVATVRLATNESYTNKDGNKIEKVEWHRVNFWRGLAQVVEKYVKKGDPIFVEGRIRNRSYEQDGVTKYTTEIEAENMVMLGSKGGQGNTENTNYQNNQKPVTKTENSVQTPEVGYNDISELNDGDDLPF